MYIHMIDDLTCPLINHKCACYVANSRGFGLTIFHLNFVQVSFRCHYDKDGALSSIICNYMAQRS